MKRFLLLTVGLLLLLSSCSRFSDDVVARVDGKKILRGELFLYVPEAEFNSMPPSEKSALIDQICDEYRMRYFLEEEGLLDTGDVKWEIATWKIRQLANMAYNHLIIDKILTAQAERELYDRLRYEINVSHILIGYNGQYKTHDRSREEAETLAAELEKSLTEENFYTMAEKYSDDPSREQNGGNLGWGKSGSWVDSFEEAAFKLEPGKITGSVETPFGFHFIKLNERRELIVDPFETMRPELRDIAFNKWQNRFMLREQAVFDSLSTAGPLVYKDSLLNDFIERFVRLSQNVFYSEHFTAFDILDVFEDTLTVGYIGDIPINKEWIHQFLKILSLQMPPRFTDVSSFRSFVEQHRPGVMLYKTALEMGIDNSRDYLRYYNVYLAKKAASLFDKYYVFEKINPGPDALRDFYENEKIRLYFNEATVQVREVLLSDSTLAAELLQRARAGESMAELATQYSVRNVGKNNAGLIPPVKRSQYGEMGLAAFNILDGEFAGPFKVGKHYSIIRREKYIPESYKSLQQIRYRLLTDYRSQHLDEKRAEQREMLHRRYRAEVNPLYTE
ncbi:MAG: peptidylprolyl isomerase [Candidatus Neomarinimicrobiota bacterium]|jgi:parvulin-like peptidyl-prolyl isomerase|nr:peptidylprolyl isomerase [Candidatus Neomarinimicrobiota bacterium]MDD3966420.1 peptidylprolyl isomerase [Candidatus Neomarinimicrobiota bacterium]MDX9780027.1 peptidylprolyl isomerase [bacterium]